MILNKYTCIIPNYPTEVRVSDKRREKYWKITDSTIPKKCEGNQVDNAGFLLDKQGNKVLRNTKTAGKPRMISINAQKIYVGIHHSVRSKIVTELHSLFLSAFSKQLPPKIELGDNKILICLHFYDVYTPKLPDLDNLANLFVKCGVDCLTTANNPNQLKGSVTHKLGILPDDKMQFISNIVVEFTHVESASDRRLEFTLYKVTKDFCVDKILDELLKENENHEHQE
jgi:hypothetical protein